MIYSQLPERHCVMFPCSWMHAGIGLPPDWAAACRRGVLPQLSDVETGLNDIPGKRQGISSRLQHCLRHIFSYNL